MSGHSHGGGHGHSHHSDHGDGPGHGHGDDHGGHDGAHDSGHSHDGQPCQGHKHGDVEAPLLDNMGNSLHAEEQLKLKRAVYFALFMMFVEILGGILANSLAIMTDAAHMLSDVGGFIVSLVCLQLASQGVTREYTYGFKQAEVLGALLSVAIVWALTAGLLMEAFQRFYKLEEINAPYMFAISSLGFIVNLILMKVLGHGHAHGDAGGHGHSHGHGHAHGGHGDEHADEEASLAMKAAIAHVIGDIVQSLGVCVAALCIWVKPFDVGHTENGVSKWNYADPMCTVLFGILVLFTTKSTLTQTIDSLMVKAPSHIDQDKLSNKLSSTPNVESIHDLHVWALGSKDVLCTAHLMVHGRDHANEALTSAIKIAKGFGIFHATFQVEIVGEFDPTLETVCGEPASSPSAKASPSSNQHGHSRGGGHGPDHGEGHGHGGHGSGHSHESGHSCQGHAH